MEVRCAIERKYRIVHLGFRYVKVVISIVYETFVKYADSAKRPLTECDRYQP